MHELSQVVQSSQSTKLQHTKCALHIVAVIIEGMPALWMSTLALHIRKCVVLLVAVHTEHHSQSLRINASNR